MRMAFSARLASEGRARVPSPASDIRASRPNAAIHVDLWGPSPSQSIGGFRYFLTQNDDYNREVKLAFLKQKSDTAQALIDYINLA